MDNIGELVQRMLWQRRYDIIVAIITDNPKETDRERRERAKMHFRLYDQEILTCDHPTLCWDTIDGHEKTFIFGVISYMKEDEEYLNRFLKACKGKEKLTEIIGIRAR